MKWEEDLSTIYYDPAHPASFAGPNKQFQEVRKKGRFNINLNFIRKWLQILQYTQTFAKKIC